jgi:hypothetical protein
MTSFPASHFSRGKVGIESDILEVFADRRIARARIRIDNSGAATARFPEGDWLRVSVSACLHDPSDPNRAEEALLAQGEEIEAKVRAELWTIVDLPLPWIVLGGYLISARVFSADGRYRRPFDPCRCRVSHVR